MSSELPAYFIIAIIYYCVFLEYQRLQLFKTLAQALMDFNELNPSAPIQLLLEVGQSLENVFENLVPKV